MSDCRFGVSPVNYPDPNPLVCEKVLSRLIPPGTRQHFLALVSCAEIPGGVGYA